jgi:hypothetical protein
MDIWILRTNMPCPPLGLFVSHCLLDRFFDVFKFSLFVRRRFHTRHSWSDQNWKTGFGSAQKLGKKFSLCSSLATMMSVPLRKSKNSMACDTCRRKRTKCSGTYPCDMCVGFGQECSKCSTLPPSPFPSPWLLTLFYKHFPSLLCSKKEKRTQKEGVRNSFKQLPAGQSSDSTKRWLFRFSNDISHICSHNASYIAI